MSLRRSADTVAVLGGQRATASKEIGDVAVKYIKEKCDREMGQKKKERERERERMRNKPVVKKRVGCSL